MLGFGMYYVDNSIYHQGVSRYIYYRQSKAYRRIETGSHFLYIWVCGLCLPRVWAGALIGYMVILIVLVVTMMMQCTRELAA